MTIDVSTITLSAGAHDARQAGTCLLEAVAWFAGEPHGDHPACTSGTLAAFGRSLNDVLPHDKRQRLRPLIPDIAETAGDGLDERRGYLALDWLIRVYTPQWLRLVGLTQHADWLEQLDAICTIQDAARVRPVVLEARDHAAAARAAARGAAWDAAGAAAGAAARDAARAAAGAAARGAPGAAAEAAARVKLQPTVDLLQNSAIELFRAMILKGAQA